VVSAFVAGMAAAGAGAAAVILVIWLVGRHDPSPRRGDPFREPYGDL
jgi:hypothetical protein